MVAITPLQLFTKDFTNCDCNTEPTLNCNITFITAMEPKVPGVPNGLADMMGSGTSGDRLRTLEKHLKFHPQPVVPPPSHVSKLKWAAGPLVAIAVVVAAWGHQGVRGKVFSAFLQGGMWMLKKRFGGSSISSAPSRYLVAAEVTTHVKMQQIRETIRTILPLEDLQEKLRSQKATLTKDEKYTILLEMEISTFTRMIVGIYILGLTHFVSSATHMLSGEDDDKKNQSPTKEFPYFNVDFDLSNTQSMTEVLDLPMVLDINVLTRVASDACRDALRKNNVRPSSRVSYSEVIGVTTDVEKALAESLGLTEEGSKSSSHVHLHELVLGEESCEGSKNSEPDTLKKLRDLLESKSCQSLLTSTIGSFSDVIRQHVQAAFETINKGERVSVAIDLCPRLANELTKITEDDNEFLLSLRVCFIFYNSN